MEQAIEHRSDSGGIAEELAPVLHGPVRREQRRRPLVAAHQDLEEILAHGVGSFRSEVVDDEQRHRAERGDVVLAPPGELRVSELLECWVGRRTPACERLAAMIENATTNAKRRQGSRRWRSPA